MTMKVKLPDGDEAVTSVVEWIAKNLWTEFPEDQRQAVAIEVGLSNTTFQLVSPPMTTEQLYAIKSRGRAGKEISAMTQTLALTEKGLALAEKLDEIKKGKDKE